LAKLTLNVSLERPTFSLAVQHEIPLASITALFGPSGSGKTTLLRIVAGLERQAHGTVALDSTVWQDATTWVPPHRRGVGYVFQDGRLFGHLTVAENLRFAWRRAAARAARGRQIELDEAVAALDLEPLLARRPASLSGGEQQRAAIARALLTSPALLLMDEPLSSLDTARKREIVPHIEALPERFGVPVLYVTHNVDEVARLASEVVLLGNGRVAAHGPVADVLERIDLWTFTGARDAGALLRARVAAARNGIATLELGEQALRVPMPDAAVGADIRIRISARDVAIASVRPQGLSIRNVLSATLLRADLDAGGVYVELLLEVDGQHLRARITRDALEELGLKPEQNVFALIKSVALESTLLG
jgi:molybdate transport system ATP-binding protein